MKKCFKCGREKDEGSFYKHPGTADGLLGKCKDCTRKDNSTRNGIQERKCIVCEKSFKTTTTEVKRGGGLCCSRDCYYIHQKNTIKKGNESSSWRGGKLKVGGYIKIIVGNHTRADRDGYVFEHLMVMEKHIGRPVLESECVHHIDGNRENNKISNLMLFPSRGAHIRFHHQLRRANKLR